MVHPSLIESEKKRRKSLRIRVNAVFGDSQNSLHFEGYQTVPLSVPETAELLRMLARLKKEQS